MNLAAALIYWLIVALWLAVLATVAGAYLRNPRTFGATRLLLSVVAIDTLRNIIENFYFGLYFGAQYGLFPGAIIGVLGNPSLLIIPKVINVVAAGIILGLLLLRWLPTASRERSDAEHDLHEKSTALAQETEERRRLFETSLDLILITDRYGNFLRVSPSSAAILGYAPEEMTGHSAVKFVYPADLEATRNEMRLARTGRHTRNFETRYIHKDRRIVDLAWSGVWSEPEQKHFFFGRDATERKAAEESIDPDTDIQIRAVPPPEMVANLRAENIDGFLAPDPVNQRAVYDGVGFIHVLSKEIWDRHPCCAFAASKEFLTQMPNTYAALLKAIIDATAFAARPENRKQIAEAIAPANYLNQPVTVVEQVLTGTFADGLGNVKTVPDRIDFDPFPWESFAVWIMTQMKRWGQIKGEVDYAGIAKQVFLATDTAKLMKEIGLAPPASTSKTFVVMGKAFDPAKPEEYVKSFAIKRAA